MRYWLFLCLALIFAGCSSTGNVQPTLRGPIVPTRLMPSLTPTPTATDTPSPTPTDTATATFTPTDTPSLTLTPSDTATYTATLTETPTLVPSPTDTPEPTQTDTVPPPTDTPQPTDTPEPTQTDTVPPPTDTPQPTDTPEPTQTNTVQPPANTPQPTNTPDGGALPIYRNSTSLEPITLTGELVLDTIVSGTIDDEHPVALYTFNNTTPGLIADVEYRVVGENLDPFLVVLDPKGREIGRNDNVSAEDPNSAILPLPLLEAGTYVIVATRVDQDFGDSFGEYNLAITTTDPLADPIGTRSQVIGYNSTVNGALNDENPQQVYTFRGAAGDVISILMTQTSGDLDPNLTLTNNLGMQLAYNDDNLLLDTYDSGIQSYVLPHTGYYSIIAGRYADGDNSGNYRLKLTRDSQNADSIYAVIDPVNSRTLKDDGYIFPSYVMGDSIDDDNTEHAYQTLLTFRLPPLEDGQSVSSAVFQIAPCKEFGGGFETLGPLTIYVDNYGDILETRNINRPQPGARVVSTQDDCSAVDLSSTVQEAYANGDENVQLRLIFRNRTDNDEADNVAFTPSLQITLGS